MWILYAILLGALAGWIAGKMTKGSGFGVVGNIVIGILGSVLGGFVFSLLGIAAYGMIGQLIVSVIGALILLWLIQLIQKKQ